MECGAGKRMKYSVDRIDDGFISLEDETGKILTVRSDCFGGEVKEGDMVYCKNGIYYFDRETTINQKKDIASLKKKMLKKFNKEQRK